MTARLLAACLTLPACGPAAGRTWTDESGVYTIEAELVAFDDNHVILKRDLDGEMGLVDLERLSAEDGAYVAERREEAAAAKGVPQLWTLRNGMELPGTVVDFARREVTIQRRRGKVMVNGRAFDNLPAVYRRVVPLMVGDQTGTQVNDEASLNKWLVHLKGRPQTFTVDGVVMEFASGDEYVLPFFVFGERELRLLQPGWQDWLAANGQSEADYDQRDEMSLALRTRASQRDAMEAEKLRIAKLQLGMQAIDAGVTSLWEVTLYPGPGVGGSPMWVLSPGRDSRTATQDALSRYPGYTAGPVRRVSR